MGECKRPTSNLLTGGGSRILGKFYKLCPEHNKLGKYAIVGCMSRTGPSNISLIFCCQGHKTSDCWETDSSLRLTVLQHQET